MNDTDHRLPALVVSIYTLLAQASDKVISVAHLMQKRAEHGRNRIVTNFPPPLQKNLRRIQYDAALSVSETARLSIDIFSISIPNNFLDPLNGDVPSESSTKEDTIQIRKRLHNNVRMEQGVLFGVVNGDRELTYHLQFLSGGRSLFVVPAHDLFCCLHPAHEGTVVWSFEYTAVVEVDLALSAFVWGAAVFAER